MLGKLLVLIQVHEWKLLYIEPGPKPNQVLKHAFQIHLDYLIILSKCIAQVRDNQGVVFYIDS